MSIWSRLLRLAPIAMSVLSHGHSDGPDEEWRRLLRLSLELEFGDFLRVHQDHVRARELHVLNERRGLEGFHEESQCLDIHGMADDAELRRARSSSDDRISPGLLLRRGLFLRRIGRRPAPGRGVLNGRAGRLACLCYESEPRVLRERVADL